MRVSTALIYQQGIDTLGRSQGEMLRTQLQIASGRAIQKPSDDPVAAAQALVLREAQAESDRYGANVAAARDALATGDSTLGEISELLQHVRTTVVNASNATLSDTDRKSLAGEITGRLADLVNLANARDGNGKYLYAGYAVDTQPFAIAGTAVAYRGDQGSAVLQVSATRALQLAPSGSELFMQVRAGNGTFQATANPGNTGSGTLGNAAVVDPAALTGHGYELQFAVSGGATTYAVIDTTNATTVSSGNPYAPGSAITVAGMQIAVSGSPAAGDRFELAPNPPVSMFSILQGLASTLRRTGNDAASAAARSNGFATALQDIDQALEHVLVARTDAGAKLSELDTLGAGNDDMKLQHAQTLSRLEDLDYNKALARFAQQQLAVEAAQKSFLKLAALSLFEYM